MHVLATANSDWLLGSLFGLGKNYGGGCCGCGLKAAAHCTSILSTTPTVF